MHKYIAMWYVWTNIIDVATDMLDTILIYIILVVPSLHWCILNDFFLSSEEGVGANSSEYKLCTWFQNKKGEF